MLSGGLCYLQIRRRPVLSGGCATYRSEGDLCRVVVVLPTDPKETCAEWWLCYLQIRRRPVLGGGCATYRSEGDLC